MAQKSAQFRVDIQSPNTVGGMYQTSDGFGFWISEAENRHSNVYIHEGNVYVSTELLNIIGFGSASGYTKPDATIGRKRLFNIERDQITNQLLEKTTYGHRNDRELAVRQRNQEIVEWLLSFL